MAGIELPVSLAPDGGLYRGGVGVVGFGERLDDAWLLDACAGSGLLGLVSVCGSRLGGWSFRRLGCQNVQASVP
jgi:hypothetical protein